MAEKRLPVGPEGIEGETGNGLLDVAQLQQLRIFPTGLGELPIQIKIGCRYRALVEIHRAASAMRPDPA